MVWQETIDLILDIYVYKKKEKKNFFFYLKNAVQCAYEPTMIKHY